MKIPFGKAASHISKATGIAGSVLGNVGSVLGKGMTWAVDHPKTVMTAAVLAPTMPLIQSGMHAAINSTPMQITADAFSAQIQESLQGSGTRKNINTLRNRDMSRYTSPSGNIVFGLHNLRR